MVERILGYINIRPDKNQSWLLMSTVISGLLITYAHPTLVKEIISNLPAQWIAFESLAASIAGLLIGVIWQKNVRKKAIRYFFYLASAESLCGCLLGLYLCFIEWNVWVFAIASLIYSTIKSTFVGKCIMAFKAKLWIEKEREIYDNNVGIVSGIVCILGYFCALFALPSLKVALFLWSVCCIFDDIGWLIVYTKNKEELINIE
jgi:hypothetical protein